MEKYLYADQTTAYNSEGVRFLSGLSAWPEDNTFTEEAEETFGLVPEVADEEDGFFEKLLKKAKAK